MRCPNCNGCIAMWSAAPCPHCAKGEKKSTCSQKSIASRVGALVDAVRYMREEYPAGEEPYGYAYRDGLKLQEDVKQLLLWLKAEVKMAAIVSTAESRREICQGIIDRINSDLGEK